MSKPSLPAGREPQLSQAPSAQPVSVEKTTATVSWGSSLCSALGWVISDI